MPRRIVAGVLAAALALLAAGACGDVRTASRAARVSEIFAPWNSRTSPGCAVGVSQNGAIVNESAYGMADLELGVPMTPATVLAVASISKSFTALSVLIAERQGKLSLDDEVQKYIPEWTDKADHITIRHLITHTSGLRDAFTLLGFAPAFGDVNKGVVDILARQRGLNSPPGTEYSYNNGGYNLLASILERATGQPLREFAAANVFKQLGMTHSFYEDEPTVVMPGRAPGYTRRLDGWHRVIEVAGPAVVGNAGVYSTVGDLLLWTQNFDTVRVGTPDILKMMQTPLVLKNGQTADEHGVGVGLSTYRGAPTVETSGGDHGMASKVTYFPKQHSAVAVICNEDNIVMGDMARANVDELAYRVADIYLGDALEPAKTPASTVATSPKAVGMSEAELSKMTGLYSISGVDFPVLVSVRRGSLVLHGYYGDQFDQPLTPIGENRFLLQGTVPLEFSPASASHPKQWHANQRVWEPVTLSLAPAELRAYAGSFHSDELNLTYVVETKGPGLLVGGTWFEGGPVTVVPFSKDVFTGDAVGLMKYSRDARGTITAFTINRAAVHDVRFDKVK